MLGRRKHWVEQLVELNLHVAFLRHLQRVLHRLRNLVEQRFHFVRAAQIKLLLHVTHPLRLGELALRADANQTIVRV